MTSHPTAAPNPMQPLTSAQVSAADLPHWQVRDTAVVAEFTTPTYADGVAFVNAIADHAETVDHHPDLVLTYGRVTVRWWSHDVQAITSRDIRSARATDEIARQLGLTGG